MARNFILFICFSIHYAIVYSQSVPPLQWLNVTNLLQGSASPIPLSNAAIGYDPTTSSVIIFGGQSSGGVPQSTTYLLDTQSLTWLTPAPPTGLNSNPSARSAAVFASDFAASNRQGFIVIGGMDINNNPLPDVWEYDYSHQFWTQVQITPSTSPSARWGAAGGKDQRVSPITDLVLPGPNNSFYYTGGFDGTSLEPLSDVWRLNISGVLSSNNPKNVLGSWEELSLNTNSLSAQSLASTMVMDTVAIYGGCNITSSIMNDSCATQNAYALDTDIQTSISPAGCPAPRFGAALAPNLNSVSASSTQVMLLLGTFNTSLWDDDNGLESGEVAFWDVSASTWIRVIPSGDPGTSGSKPSFPGPREGSAIVASSTPIFGSTTGAYSDTLIFGGRDASGNYLNELWVLRAYNGAVTMSNPKWTGFGDGTLQTGVNASGTGVEVQFITTCASAIPPGSSPTSTRGPGSPTSTPKPSGGFHSVSTYDTSTTHKILAPLSLALLFGGVILGRAFSPFFNDNAFTVRSMAFSTLVLLVCLGLGIAGLVSAFTSISLSVATTAVNKRSSSIHLQTNHGRAALAFFIALYGILPLLWVFSRHTSKPQIQKESPEIINPSDRQRTASVDTAEKLRTTQGSSRATSRLSSRQRTHSWSPSVFLRPSADRRLSSDSGSNSSAEPRAASVEPNRTFEVVNRPPRNRRYHSSPLEQTSAIPPSLRNIDWLQRRRSLNTVGELDYAITQAQRRRERELLSTPATTEALNPTNSPPRSGPRMPSPIGILLHILLQSFIIGLAVICLIILWSHSLIGFIVFLVLTLAFYVALVVLAWKGRPKISMLAALINRLRADPNSQQSQELHQYVPSQTPPLSAPDHYLFPTQGPYYHEPPFQAASTDLSHGGPRSVETEYDDDDEDEDARQRRIESEMGRREIVTVTTVPKRQLWITNPS